MRRELLLTLHLIFIFQCLSAQGGWTICDAPVFLSRVDDIYLINGKTGYAVCGDGQIVKTTDGGSKWNKIFQDTNTYFRSVEFIDEKKGFAGGFPIRHIYKNIFLKTLDGGDTWIDLTNNLDPMARNGICGLSVADVNTIYGCGNWYMDSAYIIKSTDGGENWQFIKMQQYASSLIDMYFISKDTGFVTGRSVDSLHTAIILYTTDGGNHWAIKFRNTEFEEYCWKIQRLTDRIYFASIEDLMQVTPSILRSTDGGMSWTKHYVNSTPYNIEGIGFIDSLKGFSGGDKLTSFESDDGGIHWTPLVLCPYMDRVFRVNENVMFATGYQIWKYDRSLNTNSPASGNPQFINLKCYPNPSNNKLTIAFTLYRSTRAMLTLYDNNSRAVQYIVNADKPAGEYFYELNAGNISQGIYFVLLKTHEDKKLVKVLITH